MAQSNATHGISSDIKSLDLVGKVTRGDVFAQGGYSDIYKGILDKDDTTIEVVLKVLRLPGVWDIKKEEAEERLQKHLYREVLVWRKLKHSNIVPLLGYLMSRDDAPTMISPWYMHGNINNYLRSHPTADRHGLVRDVINGLDYLHSIPVVHGDLKAENVLVDDKGRASICDFGMTRFIDQAMHISGFTTNNGDADGTERFMAPELVKDEPKSLATDIWAVGCLVAQILTGQIPYLHIRQKWAVITAISKDPRPWQERSVAIDIASWKHIQACWNIIPSDRPTTSQLVRSLKPPLELRRRMIKGLAFSRNLAIIPNYDSGLGFSPDGKRLAIASGCGAMDIWDVRNDKHVLLRTLTDTMAHSHYDDISDVDWSASKRYVLVRTRRNDCSRIINVGTNKAVLYQGRYYACANFRPDETGIGWKIDTKTVAITDLTSIQKVQCKIELEIPNSKIKDFVFAPGGRHLVVLADTVIRVYNLSNAEVEASMPMSRPQRKLPVLMNRSPKKASKAIDQSPKKLSVSKDGDFALVTHSHRDPHLWGIKLSGPHAKKTELVLLHHFKISSTVKKPNVTTVLFGGQRGELIIASLCDPMQIQIWDRDTASLIRSFSGESEQMRPRSVSLSWNSYNPRDIMLAFTVPLKNKTSAVEIWSIPTHGISVA